MVFCEVETENHINSTKLLLLLLSKVFIEILNFMTKVSEIIDQERVFKRIGGYSEMMLVDIQLLSQDNWTKERLDYLSTT